jgi:hypothetical protein
MAGLLHQGPTPQGKGLGLCLSCSLLHLGKPRPGWPAGNRRFRQFSVFMLAVVYKVTEDTQLAITELLFPRVGS